MLEQEEHTRREGDSRWWDRHISMGSILNLIIIVFFAGGFYFWTENTIIDNAETLEKHSERLTTIEDLQIKMAEVILRQTHFSDQISRVEDRMKERYDMLKERLDRLEEQ